jgi:hypothetical protein
MKKYFALIYLALSISVPLLVGCTKTERITNTITTIETDTLTVVDTLAVRDTIVVVDTVATTDTVFIYDSIVYNTAVAFAQEYATEHYSDRVIWVDEPSIGEDRIDHPEYVGIPVYLGDNTFNVKGQFRYHEPSQETLLPGIYECNIHYDTVLHSWSLLEMHM